MYKKYYVIKATIALTMLVTSSLAISNTAKADTNNNLPYNNSSKSFKNNINNFFTADTWYRPKKINYNGERWINSKFNDYRPLLTVWWPNQDIKLNYVNYMIDKGLGNNIQSNDSIDQKAIKIQSNIEKKIKSENNVNWLNNLINDFINSQNIWNKSSETPLNKSLENGLQDGGFFRYGNNKLTDSNSNFRLFDRNGFNQNGKGPSSQSELLLGNDIDNSNPIVQSEQLNWLHYMMNFGSINKKGPDSNFDSIRIDASGSIDIDINDIASSYFKEVFKASKNEYDANNHLSISEIGNNDNDRLLMDPNLSKYPQALTSKPDQRQNLNVLAKSNVGLKPSYSYINTHDNGDIGNLLMGFTLDNNHNSKDKINNAIKEANNKSTNDELKANKEFSNYNIPSSYAVMLNDKNIVPRINYSDLYSGAASFMSEETPYFNSIIESMKARKKYVSGTEHKDIQNLDSNTQTNNDNNRQVLVSVRNGNSRTEGMAVVLGNNPNLSLNDNDKVKVSMGLQHKNQKFRPVLNSTNSGIDIIDNDKYVKSSDIKQTDENGDFYLNKNDIKGMNNPQVSGYLSTWVPMGAKDNQDARTKSSKKRVLKNQLIYPGDALDSNVIFEGFTNYQPLEEKPNTYKMISKNAKFFNDLGITYFSFPPSYRSDSNDTSFMDTVFQNGYGVKDRYDFGYKVPNKYGTANELIQAIQSLHKNNIKSMSDFVPNQVYGLPKQQVISSTRTDWFGNYIGNNAMKNDLYAARSKGSGKDYQAKFGGKYLESLKKDYPNIFKQKQISTGQTIDGSGQRITQWSAKYLNGSNIQGRGSEYVLRNENNGKYYKLGNNHYLPNDILK